MTSIYGGGGGGGVVYFKLRTTFLSKPAHNGEGSDGKGSDVVNL